MIKDYRILIGNNPCDDKAPYEWKLLVAFRNTNEEEKEYISWYTKEDGKEQTLDQAWEKALLHYRLHAIEDK